MWVDHGGPTVANTWTISAVFCGASSAKQVVQFNFPEDTSEGARARSRHLTQHGMGRAASWHGSSDLHHIQPMAHANSRALSRHAPRTGDKGLGRN